MSEARTASGGRWPRPARRRGWWALLVLIGLALSPAAAQQEVPVPPLTGHVVDLTGTLDEGSRQELEGRLAAFESARGSQIAVLLVSTTRPETIEQYGIRVAEQWKLGRKKIDDGAILLVAKNDRSVRIEVGYGLEGVLSDAVARRIIENDIVPQFRLGNYFGGIRAGTDRMMRVIEGEPLPGPSPRPAQRTARSGGISDVFLVLLVAAVFVGSVLRSIFGRLGGALLTGLTAGGIAWWMTGLMVAVLVGVLAFFFTLFTGLFGGRGGFGTWPGGWGGGGWGGGGWGGGSSGGGGWGGGGGGFGGGGASGRW